MKTSLDALSVRYWLRSFDWTSHMMKRHVHTGWWCHRY